MGQIAGRLVVLNARKSYRPPGPSICFVATFFLGGSCCCCCRCRCRCGRCGRYGRCGRCRRCTSAQVVAVVATEAGTRRRRYNGLFLVVGDGTRWGNPYIGHVDGGLGKLFGMMMNTRSGSSGGRGGDAARGHGGGGVLWLWLWLWLRGVHLHLELLLLDFLEAKW